MEHKNANPELSIEGFQAALIDMETYIDITLEDLHTVYTLALNHARIRRSLEKSVRMIMTREVVTLPPEADLHEAARVLSEHKISGAPVIDAHNRVLGVISDADLLALAGLPQKLAFRDLMQCLLGKPSPRRKTGTTVAELMTMPAITVRPETTALEAAQILFARRVKRALVIDAQQCLIGIVGRADIVKLMTTY